MFFTLGAAIGVTVAGQSGVAGPWSYQLNAPTGVIYDQRGYLYIMDSANTRIQRWTPGGTYGVTVAQSSTMSSPRGMRFDSMGNILIADYGMHRIVSFAISCRKLVLAHLEIRHRRSTLSIDSF